MKNQPLEKIHKVYFSRVLRGINEKYHQQLRDVIIPPKGGRTALEIGCGAGDWTAVLCQKYRKLDVVEASPSLLKKVLSLKKGAHCQLTAHQVMIENFQPQKNQKWQHIYLTFILEHVQSPIKVLRKVAGLLENNGKLFVAVPSANSFHRELAYRMKLIKTPNELSLNDQAVSHRRVYSNTLLKKSLQAAGFKVDREIPVGLKFISLDQMQQLPKQLVDVLCASGDLAPDHSAYLGLVARLKAKTRKMK